MNGTNKSPGKGDEDKSNGMRKLKIAEPLSIFPSHFFDHADSLEHLDLSGTGLSRLPQEFCRLTNLKIAFFSNCNFTAFPKELAMCPQLEMVAFRSNGMREIPEDGLPPKLRWLILTDNGIESLPRSIGRCLRLKKCMLAGNQLSCLPDEMSACKELGLLRLSANRFESLPAWLFNMPELAFLSFAGNPCSNSISDDSITKPDLARVPWTDVEVQQLLGEGASGIISKGRWKSDDGDRKVAIKLFKGNVTSDGTPMDEMRACVTAGGHPNLIDPLGEIHGHPDKKGLVMQLIPPRYKTLGLPPSLQSCTRDCFTSDTKMTLSQGLNLLRGVASAAAHLHSRKIVHGDLYAHNILLNDEGHALLGDFGAASIYADQPVEQLEVLAFAHLVEDVWGLAKLHFSQAELQASVRLEALHKRCSASVVSARPTFDIIVQELDRTQQVLTVGDHEGIESQVSHMLRAAA